MGFLASLFGINDAQAKSDALDAQLRALNRQRYANRPDLLAISNRQIDAGKQNVELGLAGAAVSAPFEWVYDPAEAWNNTQQGARIALDAAADVAPKLGGWAGEFGWTLLKSIPWWVWAGLAAWAAWHFGLFDLAKRKISRA